jgi:Fe-S-cluster-containing dehydrogenase component/CRP-like cAMP-binding protein
VFRAGEPASAFFVVAEGVVEVRGTRRGEVAEVTMRRAIAGDAVGEEAIVRTGAPRGSAATCATDAVVVEVPVGVFRRAEARRRSTELGEIEQRLRRSAVRDTLRVSTLGASLGEEGVRELAAAAEDRLLDRGDVVVAQGDPVERVVVVGDGMLQATTTREGKAEVRAYLARGDTMDGGSPAWSDEQPAGGAHEVTLTACGPAWVILIDRQLVRRWSRAHEGIATLRRLPLLSQTLAETRHVGRDLWRFAVAGSMLVIDDEVCVRCGQCASSCASVHGDGVSRLLRRGEKVAVHDAVDGTERAFLLPGSCQHCKNPVCMRDCPTGAIGREPYGQVFIREELCVGCGACAKACPWGSVAMAPNQARTGLVAVKCDACRGIEGGPACVASCPVDAILRVDPAASFAEVHDRVSPGAAARALPRKRSSAGWVAAAVLVATAAARVHVTSFGAHVSTGMASGVLVALLAAYAIVKRAPRAWVRSPGRSGVRWHAASHVSLGIVTTGVVAAHAGAHVGPGASGALVLAFALASATGAVAALAYRCLPAALGRVERQATLPEDLPGRARDLDDRAFGLLTGRTAAEKAVYERMLAPYARAPLAGLLLLAGGRTLRNEEQRLLGRVQGVLGAARAAQMDGLKELARWAVERRAIAAQRLVQGVLRSVVPLHVVAVGASVALLVLHVWSVARGR